MKKIMIDAASQHRQHRQHRDVLLKIARYQMVRLQQHGLQAYMTRRSNNPLSDTVRARLIKQSGASLCISNDFAIAGSASTKGIECVSSMRSDGILAGLITEAIAEVGAKTRKPTVDTLASDSKVDKNVLHRLCKGTETVVINHGYASNKADMAYINENWRIIAEVTVKAIVDYCGYKYKEVN